MNQTDQNKFRVVDNNAARRDAGNSAKALCIGKPIGFKLCIGHKAEFLSICKAMVETGIKPDFITTDGGDGGTGAAPPEFSNSVGMPFIEGVSFVYNALEGFGLKKDIKIIASGKVITGFHIFRALALGADLCNSARAMMMANELIIPPFDHELRIELDRLDVFDLGLKNADAAHDGAFEMVA